MNELVQRLCAGGSSALSTAGQAGVGKTTLAVALAHHPTIRHHFRDGVLWASLGPNPDLIAVQNSWAIALNVDLSDLNDPTQRSQRLANALGQRCLLLILDDIWHDLTLANQLRWGNPNLSYLLTSRDEKLARSFAGKEGTLHLPELQEAPSIQLLQALAPEAFAADAAAATALAKALGGLPLALELVGGYLANPERNAFADLSQQALTEVNEPRHRLQLAQQRLGSTNNAQQTLEAAFALSLEHLPAHAVNAFYALGAFAPKPASFERGAAEAVAQCDGATLALLIVRNLLEQAGEPKEWLQLHQVTADVARQQLSPEAIVRQREYYFQMIDADPSDWQRIGSFYEQVQWAWSNAPDAQSGSFVKRLRTYQTLQGRLPERIEWADQALNYAKASEQTGEMAYFLHELGYCYSDLGEKRKALDYFKQALPLRRKVDDVGGEATTLNSLGRVYAALGEKRRALDYYEQALPLRRKVGDVGGEAATLNNIGTVYAALGEKRQALDYYEQALPLMRKVGDIGGEAATHNNIGLVYADLGEKSKALDYYEQALQLSRKVGDVGGEATTHNNIGTVYSDLGETLNALDHYEQALPMLRKVGDVGGEATTLHNLGRVYADLGEMSKALDYFEQSLPLMRKVDGVGGEAATLNSLGRVYADLGEKSKALDYYEQALPLRRKVGDVGGEAATLHNLGRVYADLGEMSKALNYYEQALPLSRQVGDVRGEATTLHNLGSVYSALGKKGKALEFYEQALPLMRKVSDVGGEATTLTNLGTVYAAKGDHEAALDHFQQALVIQIRIGDRFGEVLSRWWIGVIQQRQGHIAQAIEEVQKALSIATAAQTPHRGAVQAFLEELQKTG